jgi:hypothetical protein
MNAGWRAILRNALDAAAVNNWTVVDMKRDWKVIFPLTKGKKIENRDVR